MIDTEQDFVPARVLAYAPGRVAAFAEYCTVALVETPEVFEVPGSPPYCLGLIEWTGKLVPLLDLTSFAERKAARGSGLPGHVLVLAWQPAPGEPLRYGAICAPSLVTTIRVTDAQRCEPSEDLHVLKPLAASFFESDGTVIPVIDTRKLFGASGKNLMTW